MLAPAGTFKMEIIMKVKVKGMIMSFIKSVDLYNYLLKDHHRRTAVAAYAIGKEMNLSTEELSDLVIGASLHDIGAITVLDRDQIICMDVKDPYPHSRLGSYMLESFEPFFNISRIVYYHHWPYEKKDEYSKHMGKIPVQSFIIHIADRIEILISQDRSILSQKKEITETIKTYSGTLFDPEIVNVFERISTDDSFWKDIDEMDIDDLLGEVILKDLEENIELELVEQFAFTISKIIDTRSKFTISHSFGVSAVAFMLGELLGYPEEEKRYLRIAGLLHDIGKIAIPTELIEKKGRLEPNEISKVQSHVYYTNLILKEIEGMEDICKWASNHHENRDGRGYPKKISSGLFTREMDIIAYADIYTALSENRPYRAGLSLDIILKILKEQFQIKHGKEVYEAIKENIYDIDRICKTAIKSGEERYEIFEKYYKEKAVVE